MFARVVLDFLRKDAASSTETRNFFGFGSSVMSVSMYVRGSKQ
jgi:hypothetical protein